MSSVRSMPMAGIQKPLQTQKTSTTTAPAQQQSADTVTFSGKQNNTSKSKLIKTMGALGLILAGANTAMARPMQKNSKAVALDSRQCQDCSAPPPPGSSSTSSSAGPAPSKRANSAVQKRALAEYKNAQAKFQKAQAKRDEACPDRQSNLKKECKEAKVNEMKAAKQFMQANSAYQSTLKSLNDLD